MLAATAAACLRACQGRSSRREGRSNKVEAAAEPTANPLLVASTGRTVFVCWLQLASEETQLVSTCCRAGSLAARANGQQEQRHQYNVLRPVRRLTAPYASMSTVSSNNAVSDWAFVVLHVWYSFSCASCSQTRE
eukprot:GHRR01008614.1.p1 GENE.GHRR01008614.1~~GHRR01008614.1.p1  ORF type:complete len:135 (+),score=55.01 GHRR01008614.1:692-1096(+)